MKKRAFFIVYLCFILLLIWYWRKGFSPGLPFVFYLYSFSGLFALIGFSMIFFQYVLSARIKWLEKNLGLDRFFQWHKKLGQIGYCLVLLHPLGYLGYELIQNKTLSLSFYQYPGIVAFVLLSLTLFITIIYKKVKLSYEIWKKIHFLNYLLLPMLFFHSIKIGTYLNSYFVLKMIWFGMAAVYILILLTKIVQYGLLYQRAYSIVKINQLNDRVCNLQLSGPSFDYQPGQFIFLHLKINGKKESHPFTLSSPAAENEIAVTIKAVGDFTSRVKNLTFNSPVYVEGPYGNFTYKNKNCQKIVFLAGGIGITPFMSMIGTLSKEKEKIPVWLFWSNQTVKDLIYGNELSAIKKQWHSLNLIYIFSRQKIAANGETGHINLSLLQKYYSQIGSNADFFVCGPPLYMKSVFHILKKLKVAPNKIHYERFAL